MYCFISRVSRFSTPFFWFSICFLGLVLRPSVQAQFPGFPIPSGAVIPNMQTGPAAAQIDPERKATSLDPKEKAAQDSLRKEREAENKLKKEQEALRKKIFGYSVFNNPNIKFEPNLNMATPRGYVLGAGDVVNLYISGYSEKNDQLKISPDGFVSISRIGNVYLAGKSIEEARQILVNRLSKIYVGLGSDTRLEMFLGSTRNIRVTVQGEVIVPGTYSISALSTVLNALYSAGGPNENGSYRKIKVIRQNKVVATLDLYEYLMSGIQKDDIRLQDNDNILVGLYESRVELTGKVKRPGIFEILPNERLDKVLEYAGGFSQGAYTNLIKLTRFTEKELKVLDVSSDIFSSFVPQNGDVINIEQVLINRYANKVQINGSVFREGEFSVSENATLSRLIQRAEGFKEDAFLGRILISRTRDDLSKELIQVNYNDVLSGKSPDVALRREDVVTVFSTEKLREQYNVRISGAVNLDSTNNSGVFVWAKGMTIEDLIVLAGGLSESASSSKVTVARRKKSPDGMDPTTLSPQIAEVFTADISRDLRLNTQAAAFVLEPFDEVTVFKSPNYEVQQIVTLEGQVFRTGTYAIQSKEERISSVIARAGGLTLQAYPRGAALVRVSKLSPLELQARRKTIQDAAQNSSVQGTQTRVEEINEESSDRIGINLQAALDNPGSPDDIILQDGDVLNIPKLLQTVRVQGEVLYPTSTRFMPGASLRDYISAAGGFTPKSYRKGSFVVYANGSASRTKKFLFFKRYPRIEPGSEIVVPSAVNQRDLASIQATASTVQLVTGTLTAVMALLIAYRSLNP
jgi:protein involved in polysaccharide export with SLBB domain